MHSSAGSTWQIFGRESPRGALALLSLGDTRDSKASGVDARPNRLTLDTELPGLTARILERYSEMKCEKVMKRPFNV